MKPFDSKSEAQHRVTVLKGRGAVTNLQGRFDINAREQIDVGWSISNETDPEADKKLIKTQVINEIAKSILSRNSSPDIPFNVSLNPYRGCEHGCIYCFARPLTVTSVYRRDWILKPASSPKSMPPMCCGRN
jgi:hypothetical protein